ncbi:unnamed protein product [Symbiodinium necroappetens]|uniref:Uncharacterized protein n=1 Tax=Symbiodinium necroappetens TaxID=1628268 RepID=A0A813CHC3_9DINO|nr:unnamed protein product [Symbiodinium necroappetens]
MWRLKERAGELCRSGIFRATSSRKLLSGLGQAFDAASVADFRSTTPVENVDVFISHSWSADRWEKYLAVCYFLNLGLAAKAMTAWLVVVAGIMLAVPAPSIHMMFVFSLDVPVVTFILVFFFGQHLTCGVWGPRFWVDRLCVDQTDETTKSAGIAALPTFVANSSQMLVLWDKSYYERLWCNFEVSIFVKSHDLKSLRLLPLWLAPWMLTTMLLSYISARLLAVFTELGDPGNLMKSAVGANPFAILLHRLREYVVDGQVFALFYLPSIMIGVVAFQKKLDGHQNMLESMDSFDVRHAKCAEEQDRNVIEAQVAELFDGLEDPIIAVPIEVAESYPGLEELIGSSLTVSARLALRAVTGLAKHDDCLEEFNKYVQGPMRDAAVADLGDVTDIPHAVCVLAMLPWALSWAPFAWSGLPAFHALGYRSKFDYVAAMVIEFLFFVLVCPAVLPGLLRCVKCLDKSLDRGPLQTTVACGCGMLLFNFVQLETAFFAASLEIFAITQHPALLCFFVLAIVATMFQHYTLFGAGRPQPSSREVGM